ncbi:MAG: nucleotidyltransferase domain-containing protein [Chitinispirillaceae bacterium]|nr:nucleotidyltransferase domain-containing protein [Chitinispirillaceae bacterium]
MIPSETQDEIVQRIRHVTDAISIVLFGSHAYGSPTESSDLDIAVICKNMSSKTKECVKIRRALSGIRHSIDVIVATPEEFETYKKEAGSVFRTIFEKGKILYAGQAA